MKIHLIQRMQNRFSLVLFSEQMNRVNIEGRDIVVKLLNWRPFFWDKVQSVSVIETAFFNSCIQCNLSSHCFLWSYILQTEHTKTTTTQHTHADCKTCECEQLNETMSARSKQYDMVVDTELMVLQHEGLTPYDPLTFSVNLTGLV